MRWWVHHAVASYSTLKVVQPSVQRLTMHTCASTRIPVGISSFVKVTKIFALEDTSQRHTGFRYINRRCSNGRFTQLLRTRLSHTHRRVAEGWDPHTTWKHWLQVYKNLSFNVSFYRNSIYWRMSHIRKLYLAHSTCQRHFL